MLEVVGLAAVTAGAGAVRAWRQAQARERVPVRVHVNGTRGKSTVTRLIAGALRAAGVPTLGKVTGTQARWLLPDGREEPVRRPWGRARIEEQAVALERAAALGCRAVVLECMAVRPELQWVSEHRMLQSTLGVLTNARPDHTAEMGADLASIRQSLLNTVPAGATVVVADPALWEVARAVAERRASRAVLAWPVWPHEAAPEPLRGQMVWHDPANLGAALMAAQLLGVADGVAWQGFARAAADPGVARWAPVRLEGPPDEAGVVIDATAANDPVSLELVLRAMAAALPGAPAPVRVHLVFHHRADRADRAVGFGRWMGRWRVGAEEIMRCLPPGLWLEQVWVTGAPGGARALAHGARPVALEPVWRPTPAAALAAVGIAPSASVAQPTRWVVVCGNTRGAGPWPQGFAGWEPVPLALAGSAVTAGRVGMAAG